MSSSHSSIFTRSPSASGTRNIGGTTAHDTQHLGTDLGQGNVIASFDVEPQQRLSVGRPQVEPPVLARNGKPVEIIDGNTGPRGEGRPDLAGRRDRIGDLAVDLA